MPDDLSKRGPADAQRINVHETHELRYWCTKFDCDEAKLKAAVREVGVMAVDVEKFLAFAGETTKPDA